MKKLILLLISIFLVSCASSRFDSDFSPVYVTNTSKFAILPTNAMEGSLEGLQRMEAHFTLGKEKKAFDFDVYVISNENELSMTILNEFGSTMASLFYDGVSLDFDSAVFPENFKSEYIVADFQFCLYDAGEIKSALKKIGLDFEVSIACGADGESVESRILSKKDKRISKITKTYGKNEKSGKEELKSILYENFLRGYSYTLSGVSE